MSDIQWKNNKPLKKQENTTHMGGEQSTETDTEITDK